MKIPGYKLLKIIATGGTATVYLGVQESLERKVAVKILNKIDQSEQSQRFLTEGKIIAALNHRNIITVHDVGKVKSYHYISMEYLQGGSLTNKIKKGMEVEEALDVMRSIGRSLEYVHRKGLVHRDIKPGNILFHKDGTAKLTDFGIAKIIEQSHSDTIDSYTMGTPYYISPELVLGKPQDNRSDLYGLGICFYEMLTGEKPYVENTHVRTMVAHVNKPLPMLPKKHEKYQYFLNKLLAKLPRERFQSAKEMLNAIEKLEGKSEYSPSVMEKSKTWFADFFHQTLSKQKIAAATILALIFSGITFISSNPNDSHSFASKPPDSLNTSANTSASIASSKTLIEPNLPPSNNQDQNDPLLATSAIVYLDNGLSSANQYISAGNKAFHQYKLTQPLKDNAYYYYQKALALDSGNIPAILGIEKIANRYALLAEKQIRGHNLDKARTHIERGLMVDANHNGLLNQLAILNSSALSNNQMLAQLSYNDSQSAGVSSANTILDNSVKIEVIEINPKPKSWGKLWEKIIRPYGASDTIDYAKQREVLNHLP